jgi:hypothetical protein
MVIIGFNCYSYFEISYKRNWRILNMLNCTGIWLKKGSTDKTKIKELQHECNVKGISKEAIGGLLAEDGIWGDVTDKVIAYMQKKFGLLVDKIFGPVSCTVLNNYGTSTTTAWTRIWYTRDSQDTNYTCGPSSLKMALSVYGLIYNESTLAIMVGAKPNEGTEISGIVNTVNGLGKGLKAWNETFKSWETLKGYLAKCWPVMLRVASWRTQGGQHYVVLVGLNIADGKVELGDPSSTQSPGFRATTTTDLLNRIKQVSVPSVIVISK